MKDAINPIHYKSHKFECIEFTQHLNFCLGNAFKYVWRWQRKNGPEDLKKAIWYLNQEMEIGWPSLSPRVYDELCVKLDQCGFGGKERNILREVLAAAFFKNDMRYGCIKHAIKMIDYFIMRYGDTA